MPGNSSSPALSLRIRLRRSSALTGSTRYSERRRSAMVWGRLGTVSMLGGRGSGTAAYTPHPGELRARATLDQRGLAMADPARGDHPGHEALGDGRVLAEVEVDQGDHQVAADPALAAERLAAAVVHGVGRAQAVGAVDRGAEVELVAAQAGPRTAEQAVGHHPQVAVAGPRRLAV